MAIDPDRETQLPVILKAFFWPKDLRRGVGLNRASARLFGLERSPDSIEVLTRFGRWRNATAWEKSRTGGDEA